MLLLNKNYINLSAVIYFMPRKGFKTITVKENVYDYFFKEWQERRQELEVKGIRSFSGYISYRLSQLIEQEKKQTPQ
jgi:hypothetical protein